MERTAAQVNNAAEPLTRSENPVAHPSRPSHRLTTKRRTVPLLASIAAAALIGAACSNGTTESEPVADPVVDPVTGDEPLITDGPGSLDWDRCGVALCAELEVPLDPADEELGQVSLIIEALPTSGVDSLGSLVIVPGGPGEGGVGTLAEFAAILPPALTENFDLVGFDPRGVGASREVTCGGFEDLPDGADLTPDRDDEAELLLAAGEEQAKACERESGDILPFVGITNVVSDLEALREALGDDGLTYLGYGYGVELGARYVTRYPDNVRAMVLDSAPDPSLGWEERVAQQALGREAALERFFGACVLAVDCEFTAPDGDLSAAYDAIVGVLDADPLVFEGEEIGEAEFVAVVNDLLYAGEDGYEDLALLLAEVADGDATLLGQLAAGEASEQEEEEEAVGEGEFTAGDLDELLGEYDGITNVSGEFDAVTCLDATVPRDRETFLAAVGDIAAVSPRFGEALAMAHTPCVSWPVPASEQPVSVENAGPAPVLVLNATTDPATPLVGAEALVDQLGSAELVVKDSGRHGVFPSGDPCVDDVVTAYLLDVVFPAERIVCDVEPASVE